MKQKLLFLLLSPILAGCLGYPESVKPVSGFQIQNYLGEWYEIARLDHKFERGLDNVTAVYSLRDDGGVKVQNRGYSEKKDEWKEAVARGYFVEQQDVGYLKVSFFGPFFGSYVIFELDDREYAFVCGSNTSYLWLLSREPKVSEQIKKKFITKIEKLGFDSKKLIWVSQTKNDANLSKYQ
jgi:apolipoprotein D and lipocalin family protein